MDSAFIKFKVYRGKEEGGGGGSCGGRDGQQWEVMEREGRGKAKGIFFPCGYT